MYMHVHVCAAFMVTNSSHCTFLFLILLWFSLSLSSGPRDVYIQWVVLVEFPVGYVPDCVRDCGVSLGHVCMYCNTYSMSVMYRYYYIVSLGHICMYYNSYSMSEMYRYFYLSLFWN